VDRTNRTIFNDRIKVKTRGERCTCAKDADTEPRSDTLPAVRQERQTRPAGFSAGQPTTLIVPSSCNVPVLAVMTGEDLDARSTGGHDWQQQKRFVIWPGVDRRIAPEDLCRTVVTIIVQPRSGAT
jgi:hypothetical protein